MGKRDERRWLGLNEQVQRAARNIFRRLAFIAKGQNGGDRGQGKNLIELAPGDIHEFPLNRPARAAGLRSGIFEPETGILEECFSVAQRKKSFSWTFMLLGM
jgi:hypothetical protein